LTALAAVAMAKPEAEAGYYGYHPGYYGYGHGYGVGYGVPSWPGVRAPGFSSTCFGCRGKRSAEADAEPGYYGYAGYPYGYYGVGFGYGHALPGHSYAHVHRVLGKRSAEADAEPGYFGYYGYPAYGYYGYPYFLGHPALKDGAAGVHPNGGTSSVARSPQGLGK